MLVQAQVVLWWGTGRPAEFSPSGFHPVTGIAYRQEDRRIRLLNRVDSATARGQPHTLSGNDESHFPGQRIGSADPSVPPVPGTEAHWRSDSADATAPEQISQMPALREFRLARVR